MRTVTLFFLIVVSFVGQFALGKFSDEAWKEIEPIYKAIRIHPFNQELAEGKLSKKRFAFYSAQDGLYLKAFSKALISLANKLDDPAEVKEVLRLAGGSLTESKPSPEQVEMAPANFSYSNYLLATAANGGPEILSAALLPCFWIYVKLAKEMKESLADGNPYRSWITQYSSSKYEKDVAYMIDLTDKLAERSPERKAQMVPAFITASRLEWYFWDSAYKLEKWMP